MSWIANSSSVNKVFESKGSSQLNADGACAHRRPTSDAGRAAANCFLRACLYIFNAHARTKCRKRRRVGDAVPLLPIEKPRPSVSTSWAFWTSNPSTCFRSLEHCDSAATLVFMYAMPISKGSIEVTPSGLCEIEVTKWLSTRFGQATALNPESRATSLPLYA